MKAMCEFFGVSRAAYYAWVVKHGEVCDPDAKRKQLIQEAYEKSHKTYGYRRITLWLRKHKEVQINSKAVLRLMNRMNIRSVARQRKIYKKVTELGTYHRYENVLNREFTACQPNQKWVTDITYIATQQGWCYLSTIKDLYDNFIVAHGCALTPSVALVLRTVRQAKQKEKVTVGLILHSDQGAQYTSQDYHDVLTKECQITPSMSRRGNCWDNAPMENFFGHLKEEYLRRFKKPTFKEMEQLIDEYIYFYNYERIQLKTRQTPFETRCLSS
ncbi:MAG: IS3 family transposase [Anaerolineales bacterium]|nr:IS3 family transposase [Anaerolineales bacterium]MCC7189659.1 IS3 family transposase [Anaerolineales bacterium]